MTDSMEALAADVAKKPMGLKEYLLKQFHENSYGVDQALGEFLIDCVAPNGYIYIFESVVAGAMNTPISKVKEAIRVIQSYRPVGVGARNKLECFTIQLKAMTDPDPVALEIVHKYMPDLRYNRFEKIAQDSGHTLEEVMRARNLIRTLVVEPGTRFYQDQYKRKA